jgi:hypothetical protein
LKGEMHVGPLSTADNDAKLLVWENKVLET